MVEGSLPHFAPEVLKASVCGPERARDLESLEDGEWTTVRLWDNADVVDEHHEHEYTRAGGKKAPAILEFSSSNEAMAAAIKKAKTEAPEIVRQWRES